MENFVLLIVGAEEPYWEVHVDYDYSLEVHASGIGTSLLTLPGHWWTADGAHRAWCLANGELLHWGGSHYIVASFATQIDTVEWLELQPGIRAQFGYKVEPSGTLKKDPTTVNSGTMTFPGPVLNMYFDSKSVARLKEIPYSASQLQSVLARINKTPLPNGGDSGYWRGTATAYDGGVVIGSVDIP
jgi:hypothetical protein